MIQEPTSRARLLDAAYSSRSSSTRRSERQRTGVVSLVFFRWVLPLLRTAQQKQLAEEDLLPLLVAR